MNDNTTSTQPVIILSTADDLAVREYLIDKRGQAIADVHRLSQMVGYVDPCLSRAQIDKLCKHFGVKRLGDIFRQIDVT